MIQTGKAFQTKKASEVFKKDWKIVIFFNERLAVGKKIQVIELPSSKRPFNAITTEGVLSVDYVSDEYTMFNTGPCRYIALNAAYYAGSNLPMAFANDHPIKNAPLNISVVSLSTKNSTLVNETVFVTKVQKMKDNLYRIFTETDDYYFVTVE